MAQFLAEQMKLKLAVRLDDRLLQLGGLRQGPLVQFQQRVRRQLVGRRIEPMQVGEQVARGVAEPAVGLRRALHDLIGDMHLAAVVRRRHPQPQYVRPQGLHHLLRRHHIA